MVGEKLGCLCLRRSTREDTEDSVYGKELEADSGNFRSWYMNESESYILRSIHLVRPNPAVQC